MWGREDFATSGAAREALSQFGLSDGMFTDVPSFSHHVALVKSGGHVAYLKKYPASARSRVERTVRLAERVLLEGITAPTFWRTQNGKICASVDDSLFTLSRSIGQETLLRSYGTTPFDCIPRFLARLHGALRSGTDSDLSSLGQCPAMWDSFDRDSRLEELESHLRNSQSPRCREFSAALREVERLSAFSSLHEVRTPSGPVHGDFWPGNLIRTCEQEGGLGIVDFDDAFHGPLLLDVAQFVDLGYALFSGQVKVGINTVAATRFARRYAVEAGFPDELLLSLPEVLVAARTCSILWIIERHITLGPSPLDTLLDNDIRTIRFVVNRTQLWQDQLLGKEKACS